MKNSILLRWLEAKKAASPRLARHNSGHVLASARATTSRPNVSAALFKRFNADEFSDCPQDLSGILGGTATHISE
jgi:hypothetical protein